MPQFQTLQSYLLSAPWPGLISILLLFGCAAYGTFVIRLLISDAYFKDRAPFLGSVIGAALLASFAFPWVLFGSHVVQVLKALGFITATVGLCFLTYICLLSCRLSRLRNYFAFCGFKNLGIVLLGLVFSYGLLSLAPSTDADSLDYHLGIALQVLNTGGWIFAPEWFHSRLAGSGEVLNAIGLSIGAEQFGSLLQFSGLLAIVSLLVPDERSNPNFSSPAIFAIIFAASPALLQLISASKPLLLPVAMTTLAFALIIKNLEHRKAHFLLACFLVMSASQMKLNFLMSGCVVGLMSLVLMRRAGHLRFALLAGVLLACFIMLPYALWKSIHFGGSILDALLMPFPGGWPGYGHFELALRNWRESALAFPFSLVFTTSPGLISTTLGIGPILAMIGLVGLVYKDARPPISSLAFIGVLIVTILGVVIGQSGARFYLEPFAWILLLLSWQKPASSLFSNRIVLIAVLCQALLTLSLIIFGIYALFPGALSPAWRSHVMERSANEYAEMQWAAAILPADAVLLSEARSKALAPVSFVSLDWATHVNLDSIDARPYLDQIVDRGVTHILVKGDPKSSPWRGCFGQLVDGPFKARMATRNPLNSGPAYDVWLYRFNSNELPGCLTEK